MSEVIDLTPQMPGEPMPLHLGKEAREKLLKLGVKSVAVILFDEFMGPTFQFYYSKRSRFIARLFENKAFPVELSIIGKHVREMIFKDGTRVIIVPFVTKGKFGEKVNYILVELRERFVVNKRKLIAILEEIVKELSGKDNVDKEVISEALRKTLLRKSYSAK